MADIECGGKQTKGSGFSGSTDIYNCIYDFSVDGGATTDEFMLFEAGSAMLAKVAYIYVETAVTSGGSLTMDIGVDGGDEDEYLAAQAVAGLTASTSIVPIGGYQRLGFGDEIMMSLGTAAATAGKVHVGVEVMSLDVAGL